jgi:hypothetical protein
VKLLFAEDCSIKDEFESSVFLSHYSSCFPPFLLLLLSSSLFHFLSFFLRFLHISFLTLTLFSSLLFRLLFFIVLILCALLLYFLHLPLKLLLFATLFSSCFTSLSSPISPLSFPFPPHFFFHSSLALSFSLLTFLLLIIPGLFFLLLFLIFCTHFPLSSYFILLHFHLFPLLLFFYISFSSSFYSSI